VRGGEAEGSHVRRRAAVAEEAGVEAASMAVEETDSEKTDGDL
jgi:hypothetical protein